MLADLAMRDGQPVAAFDLFGDLDLRRGGARVVALPGGSLTALVDAAVQVPARGVGLRGELREPPGARRAAGTSDTRCSATRRRRCARCATRSGWRRRCATPASCIRARSPRRPTIARAAGCASRCAGAAARACARGAAARCRPARSRSSASTGSRARRRRSATGWTRSCSGSPSSSSGGARSACAATAGAGTSSRRACPRASAPTCWGRRARSARAWPAAFALRGLFGVDFVWDGERAWTIEVNPRPTASLEAIEAAYGVGVFGAHLRACAGELPHVRGERRRRGRQGRALRHRGRGHRRQRPLAGARRARRPASRRAHRRGASDLHGRGGRRDAARTRSSELEEQAARLRAELEPRVEVAAGG